MSAEPAAVFMVVQHAAPKLEVGRSISSEIGSDGVRSTPNVDRAIVSEVKARLSSAVTELQPLWQEMARENGEEDACETDGEINPVLSNVSDSFELLSLICVAVGDDDARRANRSRDAAKRRWFPARLVRLLVSQGKNPARCVDQGGKGANDGGDTAAGVF